MPALAGTRHPDDENATTVQHIGEADVFETLFARASTCSVSTRASDLPHPPP